MSLVLSYKLNSFVIVIIIIIIIIIISYSSHPIKQRIGVLNAQRETYVAEQTRNAPGANELENSILGAIERSAKAKGMKFVSPPAPVAPDGKTKAVLQDQAKEQG